MILQVYPCYADISVFFTPSKKCENSIIQRIDKAEESIDAAVYYIKLQQVSAKEKQMFANAYNNTYSQ